MTKYFAAGTLGLLTAYLLATAGCKKDDQPANSANNMQPQGGYGSPQGGYNNNPQGGYGSPQGGTVQPQPTAQPTAAPAAQPGTFMGIPLPFPMPGATGASGGTPAAGGGGGTEVANNGSLAAFAGQGLLPLQQQNAPGSHQVGEALAGNLSAGQFIKTSVQLQPGKCYTGIGQGTAGAVSVELVVQVGTPPLAASQQPGLQAVFGAGANCFKNPTPLPMPVIFRVVAQGSGPVAAALYEKLTTKRRLGEGRQSPQSWLPCFCS